MNIQIRQAVEKNLSAVQALSQELFEEEHPRDSLLNMQWSYQTEGEAYFRKRVSGEEGICFVAEDNGKIIGYTTGNILPMQTWRVVRRIEMENLLVSREYRGQRIGEQLIEALVTWGKSLGADRLMVITHAANNGAIKFYNRNGFVPHELVLEKIL